MRDTFTFLSPIAACILVVFLIGTLPQILSLLHQETITANVIKSERITSGDSSNYLV